MSIEVWEEVPMEDRAIEVKILLCLWSAGQVVSGECLDTNWLSMTVRIKYI